MELNGELLYRDATHFRRNLPPKTLRALADLMGLTAAVRAALAPSPPGAVTAGEAPESVEKAP
jgi:hypothetical protein